jgi:hypothetical protein
MASKARTKFTKHEEDDTFVSKTTQEVSDEIIAAMEEGKAKIAELEAENAELRKRLTPPVLPSLSKTEWKFINELRERDISGETKTCAACTRRCTWLEMDYGKSDFCDKCLGK